MPTSHRVACFRDDIVFLIYLYQRYLYPVDYSRINEFGEKGDESPNEPIGVRLEDMVVQQKHSVISLAWHPSQILIVIAWSNGTIEAICPEDKAEFQIVELKSEAVFLQWSQNGQALFIVSDDGKCGVYSFMERNSMKKSSECNIGENPTASCLRIASNANDKKCENNRDDHLEKLSSSLEEKQELITNVQMTFSIDSTIIVGTESGRLYLIDQNGDSTRLCELDDRIEYVANCDMKNVLIALTSDMMLYHLVVMSDLTCQEKLRAKLNGKPGSSMLRLKHNILLISHQGRDLRVWDLESEENGTISLESSKGFDADDVILCVDYCKRKGKLDDSLQLFVAFILFAFKGIISAGTINGKVANWKRRIDESSVEKTWRLQNANQIGGKNNAFYSVKERMGMINNFFRIIVEEFYVAAIQNGPSSFTLVHVETAVNQELKLDFHVKGICLQEKQLVVWSVDTSSLATIQSSSFSCTAQDVVIYQQTLYCIEGDKINIRRLQGTICQILSLPEMEGDPVMMNSSRNWLAVATSNGFLRIYNLSGNEAKQEFHSKYVVEVLDEFSRFSSMKINITGNRIAFTYYFTPLKIGDRILVWDAEGDIIMNFSFTMGMTDQQQYEVEAELANSQGRPVTAAARKLMSMSMLSMSMLDNLSVRKMEREKSRFRLPMHEPGPIFWDDADDRFLVCHAQAVAQHPIDDMILTMFVTSEHGIQLQDLIRKSHASDVFIGVSVPHLYFTKKVLYVCGWAVPCKEVRGEKTIGRFLIARSLREFSGVENCDDTIKKGMMDFCYYLAIGHMDEAFKAIRFIKSEKVWEHMASMSVKSRRLDVAAVCLGNMRNVRGARALRKAQEAGENDALQCAALAVELGMLDEAEAIYISEGRYDLLNKIYQAQNSWNQAFEVASRYDRIHRRNTHYNYAKYLEKSGALDAAVENYEKSETHHFEVPRMFADTPKILEGYIRRKKEPELQAWWARYLESIGELEGAVSFYSSAKDIMSVVRIKCSQGHIDEVNEYVQLIYSFKKRFSQMIMFSNFELYRRFFSASTIASESNDRAACYHLARVYEAEGEYSKAVDFYTKAHAYNSAIRLVKEHDMRDLLANLCLMSGGSEIVEAARYFEDLPGYIHQAVMLYHKAGMVGRALDLAFRAEQFSALDLITKDLNADCDSNVLKRAAEFFSLNQNHEKAVELLCMAKEFNDAIEICRTRNVRLTEKIAELMTPTKETTPNEIERKHLFENIAELGVQQGNYHFAAKKYTQAGEKLQAMRALLKSGDTEKIVFFANTARDKDIYILAANYLQTTDWQGNAKTIRDIETFYTKAHSLLHLANFYKSCAFMEVETFNDFSKATDALRHAMKITERGIQKQSSSDNSINDLEQLKQEISEHLSQLAKFERIKEIYATNENDAVLQLQSLVENSSEDSIIRPSHIYALLIAHHAGKHNYRQAYRCITQLQKMQKNLDLSAIVSEEILDKICDDLGVPRLTVQNEDADSENEIEGVEYSHAMKKRGSLF
ncbi:tetratricopeptide repeat protein [Dictyocaulus viviparus]|uniref:Tetratricopeptide repeat protein n=1 Tax=Dictyocaulus viviparus TaxID=29172 RepID=A0A0D8XFW2_DICVI|nr:tetratricopeptide repeat protein [Dictyocaulus viviparus]